MTEGLMGFVWRTFSPGTSVVVGEGPLQGLHGTVVGLADDERLIIELAFTTSSVAVEFDPTGLYVDDGGERPVTMH